MMPRITDTPLEVAMTLSKQELARQVCELQSSLTTLTAQRDAAVEACAKAQKTNAAILTEGGLHPASWWETLIETQHTLGVVVHNARSVLASIPEKDAQG